MEKECNSDLWQINGEDKCMTLYEGEDITPHVYEQNWQLVLKMM